MLRTLALAGSAREDFGLLKTKLIDLYRTLLLFTFLP